MIISIAGGRIAGFVPQALELVKGSLVRKYCERTAYAQAYREGTVLGVHTTGKRYRSHGRL